MEDIASHALRLAGLVMEAEETVLCLDSGITRWYRSSDEVSPVKEDSKEHRMFRNLSKGTLHVVELKQGWRVLKLSGRAPQEALLVRSNPGAAATERQIHDLVQLAAYAGLKATAIEAEDAADLERFRYTRWFESLDGQLRVLERERQKLAMIVNKTESGAVVFGSDYLVRWVNPAIAHRFHGEENPSTLAGLHCRNFCGSDSVCPDCPVKNVLSKGEVFHHERTHLADDENRSYYISAFPLRSPDASIDEVLVTVQDLTDLETLKKSRERYETLFQRSADAIFMVDPRDFSIIMANREAQRLTGLNEDQLRHMNLLEIHPESGQHHMREYLEQLVAGDTMDGIETEVAVAGHEAMTCNTAGLVFDLDGSPALMVEYRDVTQLRRLQSELIQADHLIALGTMNAGIAHEFKNRLAPLRAFAQMLTIPGRDPKRLMDYGPVIVREVDRLSALVGDVLEYARPQEPRRGHTDLSVIAGELVQELMQESQEIISEAGIECRVETLDSVPVLLDPDQFRRVMINLFKNALEACASCGPETQSVVEVKVDIQGPMGRVVISDNGCGIQQDQLNRIFEPFFTTKGPKGTGLGMCIVKSLVEANDGSLAIQSQVKQGTKIELRFPLAETLQRTEREAA